MSVVLNRGIDNPVFLFKYFLERRSLVITKFHHAFAARFEQRQAARRDDAIESQTIGSAIQCNRRIEITHFRLERLNFIGGDVWGIADDQMKSRIALQRIEGISLQESYSICQFVCLDVLASRLQRLC